MSSSRKDTCIWNLKKIMNWLKMRYSDFPYLLESVRNAQPFIRRRVYHFDFADVFGKCHSSLNSIEKAHQITRHSPMNDRYYLRNASLQSKSLIEATDSLLSLFPQQLISSSVQKDRCGSRGEAPLTWIDPSKSFLPTCDPINNLIYYSVNVRLIFGSVVHLTRLWTN